MAKLKYDVAIAHKGQEFYALPKSDDPRIDDKNIRIHGVDAVRVASDGEMLTFSMRSYPAGTEVTVLERLEPVGRTEHRVRIAIGHRDAITGDWAIES